VGTPPDPDDTSDSGQADSWLAEIARAPSGPMLAGDGMRILRFVPTEIFDSAGEPELAEQIDNELADRAFFHGISAALPRMAKRAFARGDKARARELAQKVIDAWSVADVPVPAVDEMRKLLLRAQ
jgi:hypothetical protein